MLSELIRSQEEQIIFEALRAGLMGYNHRCSYNQFKSISKDSGHSGTSYFLQFQFFEIELFVFAEENKVALRTTIAFNKSSQLSKDVFLTAFKKSIPEIIERTEKEQLISLNKMSHDIVYLENVETHGYQYTYFHDTNGTNLAFEHDYLTNLSIKFHQTITMLSTVLGQQLEFQRINRIW